MKAREPSETLSGNTETNGKQTTSPQNLAVVRIEFMKAAVMGNFTIVNNKTVTEGFPNICHRQTLAIIIKCSAENEEKREKRECCVHNLIGRTSTIDSGTCAILHVLMPSVQYM